MWLPTAISQALPALCIAAASGDRCTVKDAGWVAFTTTWKGPPRERRADAAADLREQLKVERPAHKAEGARRRDRRRVKWRLGARAFLTYVET